MTSKIDIEFYQNLINENFDNYDCKRDEHVDLCQHLKTRMHQLRKYGYSNAVIIDVDAFNNTDLETNKEIKSRGTIFQSFMPNENYACIILKQIFNSTGSKYEATCSQGNYKWAEREPPGYYHYHNYYVSQITKK